MAVTFDGPLRGGRRVRIRQHVAERFARDRSTGFEGESISALVRATGLDKRVIRGMLVAEGMTLPDRRSLGSDEVDQVATRYRAGESICELAVSFGTSYGTVRAALLAARIQPRPRGYHPGVAARVTRPLPTAERPQPRMDTTKNQLEECG
jgi:hypothetical protein